MAEGLTQQQIDELLGNIQSGELDVNTIEASDEKKIKEYDFRSPKRISKDQLKFLGNIFDNFARFLNMQLASVLRVGCSIDLIEVEEQDYKEYNNALSDSVLIGIFDVNSDLIDSNENRIIIEMSRPLSFCIIDLLLGGDGSGYDYIREYTEIEVKIFEYVFKMMENHLDGAWSNYIELKHKMDMIETNSRIIQFLRPDDSIALVTLKMTIKNVEGNLNICIPTEFIEAIYPLFDQSRYSTKQQDGKLETQREMLFDSIKKSSLEVKGILGETDIQLQDLLLLQKGDIVILNKRKRDVSPKVMIDDDIWFDAEIGKQKKQYAVKLKNRV